MLCMKPLIAAGLFGVFGCGGGGIGRSLGIGGSVEGGLAPLDNGRSNTRNTFSKLDLRSFAPSTEPASQAEREAMSEVYVH